jgi:hypothetical protein
MLDSRFSLFNLSLRSRYICADLKVVLDMLYRCGGSLGASVISAVAVQFPTAPKLNLRFNHLLRGIFYRCFLNMRRRESGVQAFAQRTLPQAEFISAVAVQVPTAPKLNLRFNLVEISGFEPLTPCLQSRCSPS